MFISTHSEDFLNGLLDVYSANIRVIRISREGNKNNAKELNPEEIRQIWKDPLLRYSNLLDALFHKVTILCESDSDCTFYAAIMNAIYSNTPHIAMPDVMFTHCGGKHRMPSIIKALNALGVPMKVIADFDVLNDVQPLKDIVTGMNGEWDDMESKWEQVKKAVDEKRPDLSTDDVRKQISSILDKVQTSIFPSQSSEEIKKLLKRSSPWTQAKDSGMTYLPSGHVTQMAGELFAELKKIGIHIVLDGQLESFCRSTGNHGPRWVNEVLTKDLANDKELESARNFIKEVIG